MSSVNNALYPSLYSGSYYQLNQPPQATKASPLAASPLGNTNTNAVNANNDAYTLNLSQSAQDYLAGLGNNYNPLDNSVGYSLTKNQQEKITGILNKYKDSPFTQDTFNKIQDDLKSAGLSTDTLSLEKKISSFDQTTVLLDALGGIDDGNEGYLPATTDPTAQKNDANSFMQSIISQWQSVSTTYGSPPNNNDTNA